jgi:hypothetical protein
MASVTVCTCDEHPAIQYAAEELARCLTAGGAAAALGDEGDLRLGLAGSFPEVSFEDEDADELVVETTAGGGILAGSNPRSVLFAVYTYLQELGFAWVRPGADGEVVPELPDALPVVSLRQKASYRHRCVCIEGAISEENAREMVEWMPKVGLNAYYIQFRDAFTFFDRWYTHQGNPTLPKTAFTTDDAARLTQMMRGEIKRRGLDLHMVGHGWTCEPFGIPGPGWFKHEGPVSDEARSMFAEVDGKRELWGDIALNTNLCYGNPEARRIINDAIVEWAEENTDTDLIHFWLADGSNNNCECPLCKDSRPADLYVRMLNELDAKLTAKGIDTRIVFLVYVDLLWPPVTDTELNNPDRFVLMFAPITRSYSTPFAVSSGAPPELPPYERNKLEFPKDPGSNLAFLKAWQDLFPCEGFDFDYHFMWDHHRDPGQYGMVEVLHQDLQRLCDIGLDGFISCQNQRVFFPTGLGMTVMGRTLWNKEATFEEIAEDYFESAFGEGAAEARAYLASVSELINPRLIRDEASDAERVAAPFKLTKVRDLVSELKPAVERGLTDSNPARAASWRYLELHGEFVCLFADAMSAKLTGAEDAVTRAWTMFNWAREHEMDLQPLLDVFEFQLTLAPFFGIPRSELVG